MSYGTRSTPIALLAPPAPLGILAAALAARLTAAAILAAALFTAAAAEFADPAILPIAEENEPANEDNEPLIIPLYEEIPLEAFAKALNVALQPEIVTERILLILELNEELSCVRADCIELIEELKAA